MLNAVDTNVLVRFLVDDGTGQVAVARNVFDSGAVFVAASVILESEWVLRSSFGIDRGTICEAFTRVLNMQSVTVEQEEIVSRAVDAYRDGLDFADALHLYCAVGCTAFYTFDEPFRRKANALPQAVEVRSPKTMISSGTNPSPS